MGRTLVDRALGVDARTMQVEVTIGVQKPEKVDAEKVKASLPHGTVSVRVVKGGLDVPDDERDDVAVIASAAVAVRSGPGTQYSQVGTVVPGQAVAILCQLYGSLVVGSQLVRALVG